VGPILNRKLHPRSIETLLRGSNIVPSQLLLSPMEVCEVGIEHAPDVAIERPHHADARVHGKSGPSAAPIRHPIAVCHSAAAWSAFGSFMMWLAASWSVTSWRPLANGMGSSKGFQPRSAFTQQRCLPCRPRAPRSAALHQPTAFAAPSLHPMVARIQTSRSSSVVKITGMALGWIGSTIAFGAVVRKP
jgi:hypothetical protein